MKPEKLMPDPTSEEEEAFEDKLDQAIEDAINKWDAQQERV